MAGLTLREDQLIHSDNISEGELCCLFVTLLNIYAVTIDGVGRRQTRESLWAYS